MNLGVKFLIIPEHYSLICMVLVRFDGQLRLLSGSAWAHWATGVSARADLWARAATNGNNKTNGNNALQLSPVRRVALVGALCACDGLLAEAHPLQAAHVRQPHTRA